MPFQNARSKQTGASILEMCVVLAIIVLMTGVVIPEVRNYLAEAKAAKITAVYRMAAEGAMKYWADTGYYGTETSGTDPAKHQLFYKQSPPMPGWSGPYLAHPLNNQADNPYKSKVELTKDLTFAGILSGFDLDGDGTAETTQAEGNMIVFHLPGGMLNDPVVRKVDLAIDGKELDPPDKPGVWSNIGRVKVIDDGSETRLYMFIFTMDKP